MEEMRKETRLETFEEYPNSDSIAHNVAHCTRVKMSKTVENIILFSKRRSTNRYLSCMSFIRYERYSDVVAMDFFPHGETFTSCKNTNDLTLVSICVQ